MQKYYVNVYSANEAKPAGEYWYSDVDRTILHRVGGPALDNVECKKYYTNGVLTRTDGPAIEFKNGAVTYAIDGKKLTKEQFDEHNNPTVELTVAEIEKLLGKRIKVVKG